MATTLTQEHLALRDEVTRFAEAHIAGRVDLSTTAEFPWDIWRAMGQGGLLGIGLPEEYGGRGGGCLSLAVSGEALVGHGHNLGLAVSWLIHLAVARFLILGFGNERQREEFLPRMAEGWLTGCLAVSEPQTGAHPKYLKTSARLQGDSYRLDGEKTYLTNGPIADLFVVMAVTGVEADRKQLTAFIVPKDAPGLSLTEPMHLDFLRPSPHGGIRLEDSLVPAANLLGEEGRAYETMVKPFRELEDTLLMGPLVGGLTRQLELLVDLIRGQGVNPKDELKASLGELQFLIHTMRIMAYEAARMLEGSADHVEFLSLQLCGRNLAGRFESRIQDLISGSGIDVTTDLETLTTDLTRTMSIAKNVALMKQIKLGAGLLEG